MKLWVFLALLPIFGILADHHEIIKVIKFDLHFNKFKLSLKQQIIPE